MEIKDCYFLGYIKKKIGTKGHVLAFLDVDDPHDYAAAQMFFVEMDSGLVPFFIEDIEIRNKGEVALKFEDINDETAAINLKSRQMYLPMDNLPKLDGKRFYYHEVIGFRLIDQKHGDIGSITEIVEMPQNDLFSVLSPTGKEVLIPLKDEIITEVNRKQKTIKTDAPLGLIDLYLDGS